VGETRSEAALYERIVIAYDGTREGRSALREGVLMALRSEAEIHLLAVVADTPGMRMAEGAHAGAMALHHDTYRAILEEAVSGLARLGVEVRSKLVRGEPAEQISGYARHVRADLVVVGHRKQSLLQRWWSGPNGAYLTDHLTCSLLIARAEVSSEGFLSELERVIGAARAPA
jgi:nucleotide-binding universal stress UspA family protein